MRVTLVSDVGWDVLEHLPRGGAVRSPEPSPPVAPRLTHQAGVGGGTGRETVICGAASRLGL